MSSKTKNIKNKEKVDKKKSINLPKPIKDFLQFLESAKTSATFAIAFISADAIGKFVNSFVKGIITPAIQILLPKGDYSNLVYEFRDSKFLIGDLISATINMIIISIMVFIFAKYITKDEKLLENVKKKASRV